MTVITSNYLWREKPPIQPGDVNAATQALRLSLLRSFRAVRGVLRAAIRERRVWRTIHTLEALDDRMLRDIGLARSAIEHHVYGRELA